MKRKILILLSVLLAMVLAGCGGNAATYPNLSSEDKAIVDTVYANKSEWEDSRLLSVGFTIYDGQGGGYRGPIIVSGGESEEKDKYNGSKVFVAIYKKDSNVVLYKYFACENELIFIDSWEAQFNGDSFDSAYPQKWDQSWSKERKIETIAQQITE